MKKQAKQAKQAANKKGFIGTFRRKDEWAEAHLAEQLKNLPEAIKAYFDYENFAKDQEDEGKITFIEEGGFYHAYTGK